MGSVLLSTVWGIFNFLKFLIKRFTFVFLTSTFKISIAANPQFCKNTTKRLKRLNYEQNIIIMNFVVLILTQVSLTGSHEQHELESRLNSLTSLQSKKKAQILPLGHSWASQSIYDTKKISSSLNSKEEDEEDQYSRRKLVIRCRETNHRK